MEGNGNLAMNPKKISHHSLKSIVALVATSQYVEKKRILFDEMTGLILAVESNPGPSSKNDDFVFNDETLLFSGMGDIHIHAREDYSKAQTYKEDFNSAKCAAINGGVVHVGDMPNNNIPPIDDFSYQQKLELALKTNYPYLLYAGVGMKTAPLSYRVPYKVFMGPSIGELFFESTDDLTWALEKYKGLDVSFHCEDPGVLLKNKMAHNHFERRPKDAEILATHTALALIEKYSLKGKLCHYSTNEGLDLILKKRACGLEVKIEVSPHHLFFSEEEILKTRKEAAHLFQMNPPIRQNVDRERLLEAIHKREIDFLATDHAPHSLEEKEKGTSGMPGLDTYALFVTWLLKNEQVDPKTIALIASENPGAFFNQFLPSLSNQFSFYKQFGLGMGQIAPGYSASFTLLNLHRSEIFTPEKQQSKAQWSPFYGVRFPGCLQALFINGKKYL